MAARPIITRQPNERLRYLVHEAGCSNAGLARRVNIVGAEHGLDLRYDKTSVARWLRGQQPRGRTPAMVAEALGRKMGRPVTVEEIGMSDSRRLSAAIGLGYAAGPAEAVDQARRLWRGDVSRQPFLSEAPPLAAVLVEPSRDWLIGEAAPRPGQAARSGQAATAALHPPRPPAGLRPAPPGRGDVPAVRMATDRLVTLDRRHGSALIRPIAVHYLDSVVGPLLGGVREEAGERTTARELYAAAARLTELAGSMAVDAGRPALALRYYIQALRLAEAGGDRGLGGYVLCAGMSRLAAVLGSPREARQLARTALEGTRDRVGSRALALFHATEARAAAAAGDAAGCQEAAGRALAAMERAEARTGPEPVWIAHFDRAYLADELAHCHRDLGQPAAAARRAQEALAGHPPGRVRRRAIDLALLASAQAEQREIERACGTGLQAVELLGDLGSARATAYVAELAQLLRPHSEASAVREFQERLAGIGTSPAAAGSR
ncbi:transcriptional regulator [Streptomyces polyrhachis]|uniref:Transcriptional regulator n=1 Tax=Streptomyces polyrhachis TaxID=1282885 RepID=A0ABW2GHH3_9ACTN